MGDGKRNDYSAYFPEGKGKKWRKKAWSMNGGGEKQKKQKKDRMVGIIIGLSLFIALIIMSEVFVLEIANAALKEKTQQELEHSKDSQITKLKGNESQGNHSQEKKNEGEKVPGEGIYTTENTNSLLNFGLQILIAVAATGVSVFQVAESNYPENRKREFRKKACNYVLFMIFVMLFFYSLFIFTEYHLEIPYKIKEYLAHIQSLVLIVIIPMLLFYVLFIFVELFEFKVPKWLNVITIATAGISFLVLEIIVLTFF